MRPALRITIILIGLVAMAGFGAYGVLGIGWGAFAGDTVPFLIVLGALSLLASAVIGSMLWRLWRARTPR